jgi:ParB-like chromosome segregation protein Spo0J
MLGVAVSQVEVMERSPAPVMVPVADLAAGSLFRDGGVCPEHVERLVGLGGAWPPIVVMRTGGLIVDGAHRAAAARRLGLARLEAVLFDGSVEEAFVEFLRRNVAHGLLLTLPERKQAALRLLRVHRAWSDRRVAELCGISPKTVGRLRADTGGCPTEEDPQLDTAVRVGRDERARPVRRGPVRSRVVEALRAQPNASLRMIAAAVGVSPETVRLVRMNLAELPETDAPIARAETPAWQADAALASAADGKDFVAWFEQTAVTAGDLARVGTVPLSRVYELADEARRRSELWLRLARALEARTTRMG